MSECFRYIFLRNNELKRFEDFNDSFIRKGTSLYEVIRIIEGQAVFLEDHFNRLLNSAKQVNVSIWYNFKQIKEAIQHLIENNGTRTGNVKLVFNIHGTEKTFYAYFVKHNYPDEILYKTGVRTITHYAERPIPTAKIYNHSLRSKTNDLIKDAEIFEVLLLNSLGYVTEGSRSNLFFIKKNELYTAPDGDVLNGIVRKKVIEIAKELEIPIVKTPISYESLPYFNAAFITGTSPMVLPVNRIDSLNYSVSNPLLTQVLKHYHQKLTSYLNEL